MSVCFMYNAAVIPLRAVFPYQTKENVHIWQYFDFIADLVYVIDIIAFKSHRKFLREGFWIKDPVETRKSYFETLQFKVRKSNFALSTSFKLCSIWQKIHDYDTNKIKIYQFDGNFSIL